MNRYEKNMMQQEDGKRVKKIEFFSMRSVTLLAFVLSSSILLLFESPVCARERQINVKRGEENLCLIA